MCRAPCDSSLLVFSVKNVSVLLIVTFRDADGVSFAKGCKGRFDVRTNTSRDFKHR